MRGKILIIISAVALLLFVACTPDKVAGGSTETTNAAVSGTLYNPDGTFAAGVRVAIRPRTTLADTTGLGLIKRLADTASVVTDVSGRFAFDTVLDTGTYVVEAASGNDAVLIDSVTVQAQDSLVDLPPDTLKPAGALKGVIRLSEGGDPRKVFVLAFGIDRFARVEIDGSFKFQGLAEGKYDLRLISSLDNYGVLDTVGVAVVSADTTNLDTLELPFTGIPTPKNLKISYDTLKEIVGMIWDRADTTLVKGYNVFRRNTDSSFGLTPLNGAILIADTAFVDSGAMEGMSYEYKVVAVDKSDNPGKFSIGDSVTIHSAFVYVGILGVAGIAAGQYDNPVAVALSSDGRIFVADYFTNGTDSGKVLVYDTAGSFLREYRGFYRPVGLAALNEGKFYIMQDDGTIRFIDTSGVMLSTFGGRGSAQGQFRPNGSWQMAISPESGLFITDAGNNRMQVLDSLGTFKMQFECGEPLGVTFVDATSVAVSVGTTGSIGLFDANGISRGGWHGWSGLLSTTEKGNIASTYSDGAHKMYIVFYSPNGEILARFGHEGQDQNGFEYLRWIDASMSGRIYVADNYGKKVKIFAHPMDL